MVAVPAARRVGVLAQAAILLADLILEVEVAPDEKVIVILAGRATCFPREAVGGPPNRTALAGGVLLRPICEAARLAVVTHRQSRDRGVLAARAVRAGREARAVGL